MKEQIDNIKADIEVRQNLIELKKELKEASDTDAFLQYLNWDMDFFRKLLEHEDPKVRKNIAQIIGICQYDGLKDDVFAAYLEEKTMFVRSDYLKVLGQMDVECYLDAFEKRQKELMGLMDQGEKEKHVSDELRELSKILRAYGKGATHKFIGEELRSDIILTTVSGKETYLAQAVKEALGNDEVTLVRGGVKLNTNAYESIMKVRPYQEMLFVAPKMGRLQGDAKSVAKSAITNGLIEYLDDRLNGLGAYRFRVAVKGIRDVDERQAFVRAVSKELEIASKHQMVTSPSDYELELRFHKSAKVENQYSLYLIFSALKDGRFAYRKNVVPTSIQPYVAALIMEMIKEDTSGMGQILDPFCGVGTMLIERSMNAYAHSMYGVDIYGESIVWAEQHADKLHMPIHFVNKDMKDFTHEYPFELILTNVPCESQNVSEKTILDLYETFFEKCNEWLAEDGIICVYSNSPLSFEKAIKKQSAFTLYKKHDVYAKGKSRLYLLKRK